MPIDSINDLPDSVRSALSDACARVWMEAFNDTLARDGTDDDQAAQAAWGAVRDTCSQNEDDTWTQDPEHSGAARSDQQESATYAGRGTLVAFDAADDSDGGPAIINGVAIGANDRVRTAAGTIRWTPDALDAIADTLEGRPLTDSHSDDPYSVIGEVTAAAFDPEQGVVYEAELDTDDLTTQIENGRLDVSPRIAHAPPEVLPEVDGDLVVDPDHVSGFRHLSIVQRGAAKSNSVTAGQSPNAALANLSATDIRTTLTDHGASVASAAGTTDHAGTQVHQPSWSSTTAGEWSKPAMEHFDTDDLSDIGEHFVVSTSGFPADSFGDLKLPVVSSGGVLNENAVNNALSRLSQTDGVSGDGADRAESILNGLKDEFDGDSGSGTDNSALDALAASDLRFGRSAGSAETGGSGGSGDRPGGDDPVMASTRTATTNHDTRTDTQSTAVIADSTTPMTSPDDIEAKLAEYDDPVLIEDGELADLRAARSQLEDDLEEQVSDLSAAVEQLNDDKEDLATEVDVLEDKTESLEAENEALEDDLTTLTDPMADALEDTIGLDAETIQDRFDAPELVDMAEAHDAGAVADLTAAPKSGDPGTDDDGDGSGGHTSDLSEDDQQALSDLRNKRDTAAASDMDGMVAHYDEQISALEEGTAAGAGGD
jgi:cation transport regulator ChaB/TolA-binding protein